MPFLGPIGAARVGYRDGKYLLNPTATQLAESKLDLVVAGTAEGVLMVESEAKGLDEETMLGAVIFGHEQMQIAIKAINELAAEAGKPKWNWVAPEGNADLKTAVERVRGEGSDRRLCHHREAAALRQDRRDQDRRAREARGGRGARSSPPIRSATNSSIWNTAWCASGSCRDIRASTAATPRRCVRSTSAPACWRARTARRCSPAARRRPWS